MTIQEYIDSVARRYASGITTEHSFRGDLQSLIESLVPDVMATNEPTRIACGAPRRRHSLKSFLVTQRRSRGSGPRAGQCCKATAPQIERQSRGTRAAERVPNLNMEIVEKIAAALGMEFVAEEDGEKGRQGDGEKGRWGEGESFAPIDILDYIYAVLHSPTYRERYKEFLKIDFPRVPYPEDREAFRRLVELGGELRQLHLLESPRVEEFITGFNVAGSNLVDKPIWKPNTQAGSLRSDMGDVFMNPLQYFANVPKVAWDFYIGGYQPAQKWLKDRKGRTLSYEDIRHYQKIIVALTETARLMGEIDRAWNPED